MPATIDVGFSLTIKTATENGHELHSMWIFVWTRPCADDPDGL